MSVQTAEGQDRQSPEIPSASVYSNPTFLVPSTLNLNPSKPMPPKPIIHNYLLILYFFLGPVGLLRSTAPSTTQRSAAAACEAGVKMGFVDRSWLSALFVSKGLE